MEERLEDANVAGPLASPHNWQDMESLAVWCRAAAALQPDGTDVPAARCEVCIAFTSTPPSLLCLGVAWGLTTIATHQCNASGVTCMFLLFWLY